MNNNKYNNNVQYHLLLVSFSTNRFFKTNYQARRTWLIGQQRENKAKIIQDVIT